jgi:hypothetical protein
VKSDSSPLRLALVVGAAVTIVAVAALWASDKITFQDERTIYTVDCSGGEWQGLHCTGRLVPADRFRFRALKPHREVVFWTVGAAAPSGKFTDCDIKDGRNWTCKPIADSPRTITLQMSKGMPVPDSLGRAKAFHAISKWHWFLLRWGIPISSDAEV